MFSGKRAVLCHLACGKGRTARVVSCHSVVVTDTTSSPRTDCDSLTINFPLQHLVHARLAEE